MSYQFTKQDVIDNDTFLSVYNNSEDYLYQTSNNNSYDRNTLLAIFNNFMQTSEQQYLGRYNDTVISLLVGEPDKNDSNYLYSTIILYDKLNNSRSWLYSINGYWDAVTTGIQQNNFLGWTGHIITSGYIDNMLNKAVECGAFPQNQQIERQLLNNNTTYIKVTF